MARQMGSQPSRTAKTSVREPGRDQDSAMSAVSLWVRTQQQLEPFLMVLKRKWTSGPIQPLNVSPFLQNSAVRGSASMSLFENLFLVSLVSRFLEQRIYHALKIA